MGSLPTGTLTIEPKRSGGAGRGLSPAYLFVALECDHPESGPLRCCLQEVDTVALGRGSERKFRLESAAGTRRLLLELPDARMSSTHAQLIRALGKWVLEDQGSKNGCFVNGVKTTHAVLNDGDLLELGHTLLLFRAGLVAPADDLSALSIAFDASSLRPLAAGMASMVPELARELSTLAQIAPSPVSILLSGPTGTGKDVLARAIHALSARSGALVAVNSGALPLNLVESELFGHKKGSFSGASEDRLGLIRSAEGGTLFLDEIGDLPLDSQAALLRVLENREVLPVGANKPLPVDFRVVSATHRDLQQMVAEGSFRSDLLARLSGFTLSLPALAERREDLGLLIGELLLRHGRRAGSPGLSTEVGRVLFAHRWPLNIRELDKAIEAALVLAGPEAIELDHLPESILEACLEGGLDEDRNSRVLDEEEQRRREQLIALLKEHGGNISAVARVMGKARMQVQRWIKRYGIEPRTLKK